MRPSNLPELLAPAGGLEALHAAVCAGADAVYLGLDEFNARRNADNFTLDDLADACRYAHLRGVSVYVTLNVEVLPGELARAVELARGAWEAGADAFIVQDMGLACELAREIPGVELHASTQMNVHSAAGIEAAARLGCARVTLARELSVSEIAELVEVARAFEMDVECFAHGALCVCYSGQCLMSSMIGGRSANRGLCAQACRLPYELHREGREGALPSEGEHLLSPRDLCTIGLLGELRDAGVASLKIEGRMKSADYVHEVVSVYRSALDELGAGGSVEHAEEKRARLAEAFSRGFTTAYLEGERGNGIMSYGRPNNRGVFAGRVADVDGEAAEIACEIALNAGDIVEFWTNRGHFAASVPAGTDAGGRVRVPVEKRVGKGDRVFRVRNAATTFSDDALEPRVRVNGHVTLRLGEPAHAWFVAADGTQGEAWGPVVESARTKALCEEDVRAHIDRLGQTPFVLSELTVEMSDGVGMGFSQLHHLRAEALEALETEVLGEWNNAAIARWVGQRPRSPLSSFQETRQPSQSLPEKLDNGLRGRCPTRVMAWVTNPGCARAARRAGADGMYVPLLNFRRGQAQMAGVRQEEAEQAGYPKQCVMALPTIEHDPVADTREGKLSFDPWDYVREGKPVFADSLAGAVRALDAGALVEIGPHVPIVNKAALEFAADLGVRRVWLSPELTLGQIAELAEDSPAELGLFVSGAQELMICEHCLLMSQGPCNEECETCPRRGAAHRLVDRKGFDFPVVTDMMGRSHLYNGIELDLASALPDLADMGISAVMVGTTLMDKKTTEAAVKRIVRAVENGKAERRPGTTTGHLFRGVL